MKCSRFKVPVKVEQINEYLFSDTVQSQKTKSGMYDAGGNQTQSFPTASRLSEPVYYCVG